MTSTSNKSAPKHDSSTIAGKDQRTQAEKDKQQAAKKHEQNKDGSSKSSNKSGDCS